MKTKILAVLVVMSGCGVVGSGGTGATGQARQPVLSCPESPAKKVFTAAMCLCGDYDAVGEGAWVHGGATCINGALDVVGHHDFSGDVTAFGGVSGVGALEVKGSLATHGRVDSTGQIHVVGDLIAASGVSGAGELTVDGTLRTPEGEAWTGTAKVAAKGPVQDLGGLPCACGKEQRFDVAAAIAQAEAKNDNQAAGLGLDESIGERALTLGSGSYVFAGVKTVGAHTLVVDGAVALYVKSDFDTVGETHLELTPGSTLDLYVDGDLSTVGETSFGKGASPGSVRIYLAGDRQLQMVGEQKVVGSIYAPESDLQLVGESSFQGSLFVRDVKGVGRLEIEAGEQRVATPNDELCKPAPVVTQAPIG